METKTYIIIIMIIIVFMLTFYVIIFGRNRDLVDAKKNIIKADNTNIDNLDVKQLKNIVNNQSELIKKQTELINSYIEKTEKNNNRFNQNVIKPDENIDKYFHNIRTEHDTIIRNNQENYENISIDNKYKINIVKTYLEDPIMRGSNIYESEQYSKLLEIGNIQIDNKNTPPNPSHYSKSFQNKIINN